MHIYSQCIIIHSVYLCSILTFKVMKTIVAFHAGRGGRFNNPGHLSFIGDYNISKIMDWHSDKLYYYNRDSKGRFISPAYFDCSGNLMISEKEVKEGVGVLNWDYGYNTDTCCYLSECSERELLLILNSGVWNSEAIVKEFFSENNVDIDWAIFNGDFEELIRAYFYSNFDIEYFYIRDIN